MNRQKSSAPSGFGVAQQCYDERRRRALELRAAGQKVVGYFCCYPPTEMLTALGLVPFRIQGQVDLRGGEGDKYLETVVCSFVRNCFELAVTGYYDFLDGLVVPHTCDTVQRIYEIWAHCRKPAFTHFLDVPHMTQPSSYVFFEHELRRMQRALEGFAGRPLTPDALAGAVALHNESRALLRSLYELRKPVPPSVSGSEALMVAVAGMTLPVSDFNSLLRQVIAEARERRPAAAGKPRLLLCGSEMDDFAFVKLLEESGADVVVDDLCTGTRSFWPDVPVTPDPLTGIAARYLSGINCPRTYRPQQCPHAKDLENRFGYLGQFARDFRVDGVVLYTIRYCDTHELDAPDIVKYFASQGLPVLPLEGEYRPADSGQLKTRIEAFLETIGG